MGLSGVTASIVTYNNENTIKECTESLLENTVGVPFSLCVVDNGSTDKTLEILSENGGITLIKNGVNVGFGKAHNKALNNVKSKYHIFVNPDIIVKDNVIAKLADYLDKHRDVALVTPALVNPNGSKQYVPRLDPSLKYLLSGRLPFLKKTRAHYTMVDRDLSKETEIEVCTGCFMMGRTEQLKQIGGFDSRYFMYVEDADISREMRRFGKIMLLPQYSVTHKWNRASSHKIKYLFIHISSAVKYRKKWRKKA